MRYWCIVGLATLVATGGCGSDKDLLDPARVVSQAEGIRISLRGGEILIQNASAEPVRFAAVERYYFEHALASWCLGFTECGTPVLRAETASLRLADVAGFDSAAKEVLVFWWYDRPGAPDEEKVKGVRRVVVPL